MWIGLAVAESEVQAVFALIVQGWVAVEARFECDPTGAGVVGPDPCQDGRSRLVRVGQVIAARAASVA